MRVIFYKNSKGWNFRLKARNGNVLMTATGYNRSADARRAFKSFAKQLSAGRYKTETR